jgi:hypothetical protein
VNQQPWRHRKHLSLYPATAQLPAGLSRVRTSSYWQLTHSETPTKRELQSHMVILCRSVADFSRMRSLVSNLEARVATVGGPCTVAIATVAQFAATASSHGPAPSARSFRPPSPLSCTITNIHTLDSISWSRWLLHQPKRKTVYSLLLIISYVEYKYWVLT